MNIVNYLLASYHKTTDPTIEATYSGLPCTGKVRNSFSVLIIDLQKITCRIDLSGQISIKAYLACIRF